MNVECYYDDLCSLDSVVSIVYESLENSFHLSLILIVIDFDMADFSFQHLPPLLVHQRQSH